MSESLAQVPDRKNSCILNVSMALQLNKKYAHNEIFIAEND